MRNYTLFLGFNPPLGTSKPLNFLGISLYFGNGISEVLIFTYFVYTNCLLSPCWAFYKELLNE